MALPINIEALLNGSAVEWERIEFKEGWNAEEVVHAVCAFANDFHNWGGGYLILGVKTDSGRPVLPPEGLQPEQADAWQRKLLELGYLLRPTYHPMSEVAIVSGKLVLAVWISAGEMRPYEAPASLAKDNRQMVPYVRIHANTVQAKGEIKNELHSLANRIPFDDRQNGTASATDLQPTLIQNFLSEVKSSLATEASQLPIEVQITPEEITILSLPGPDPTIGMDDLRAGRAVARRYRNRRIGEFLKELELSEGRGTGIPKILESMRANGSPEPAFETDAHRTAFLVRLPLRAPPKVEPGPTSSLPVASLLTFSSLTATPRLEPAILGRLDATTIRAVLQACSSARRPSDLQSMLGAKDRFVLLYGLLAPLMEQRWVERTQPWSPHSPTQRYRTTDAGKEWLAAHPAR